MTTYKENVGISNKGNKKKKSCQNISFLNFLSFDWIRPLINDLIKGDIQELPNICRNFDVPYYASKLEENLRDIEVEDSEFYSEKNSSNEHVLHHCNSNDASEKKVYNVYYHNILWSILKTFKFRIILIISFYILETLIVTLGGEIHRLLYAYFRRSKDSCIYFILKRFQSIQWVSGSDDNVFPFVF